MAPQPRKSPGSPETLAIITERIDEVNRTPLQVPLVAFYSRRDGVVSWRASVDRLFAGLLVSLNTFASLWIVFLVGVISVDVIGRTAFNVPLPGVPEITRLSLVAVFWLQVAHTLRTGGHLRTTTLLDRMGERTRRSVLVVNALCGEALLGAIAYWGNFDAVRAWETAEFEGEEPVRVPTWPLWWALTIGAALTSLQYLIRAYLGARSGYMDRDDGALTSPGAFAPSFQPPGLLIRGRNTGNPSCAFLHSRPRRWRPSS